MNNFNKIITLLIAILLVSTLTLAHRGKIDSNGCHKCWTNCEKYGLEYGFYHRHNPIRPCFEELLPLNTSEPTPTEILPPQVEEEIRVLCSPGFKCKNSSYKGYQFSDCSWRLLDYCKNGCDSGQCLSINESIKLPPEDVQKINKSRDVDKKLNTSEQFFKVVNVIDGDTIKIKVNRGSIEVIRLLGIDSSEINKKHCFAREAKFYLSKLLDGKFVRLERDSTQPDRDRFKRLLRYVYLEDGTLVNAEMVKYGYAKAYTKYNSDKLKEFLELEKIARNEKRGLWGLCTL